MSDFSTPQRGGLAAVRATLACHGLERVGARAEGVDAEVLVLCASAPDRGRLLEGREELLHDLHAAGFGYIALDLGPDANS
jgi:hypothetical protein